MELELQYNLIHFMSLMAISVLCALQRKIVKELLCIDFVDALVFQTVRLDFLQKPLKMTDDCLTNFFDTFS